VAYPSLTGPVALDDEVLVNVEARELGLGTGGFDVLYANLTRGLGLEGAEGAHVMVLPYTPLQHARCTARRREARGRPRRDAGRLLLAAQPGRAGVRGAGGLRSRTSSSPAGAAGLALGHGARAAGAWARRRDRGGRAVLRRRRAVRLGRVGARWARGGARRRGLRDRPGIVGTGTRFGHGGLASAEAANAALALGGVPVIAVRASAADERLRHRGVSHHTEAVLSLVRGEAVVRQGGEGWREACDGLSLSHMGRGPDDDPEFFAAAYAAGTAARELVAGGSSSG
jgi:hypothetical protein